MPHHPLAGRHYKRGSRSLLRGLMGTSTAPVTRRGSSPRLSPSSHEAGSTQPRPCPAGRSCPSAVQHRRGRQVLRRLLPVPGAAVEGCRGRGGVPARLPGPERPPANVPAVSGALAAGLPPRRRLRSRRPRPEIWRPRPQSTFDRDGNVIRWSRDFCWRPLRSVTELLSCPTPGACASNIFCMPFTGIPTGFQPSANRATRPSDERSQVGGG